MYDCSEYAESRLSETIVRKGDMPVRVLEVDGDFSCSVRDELGELGVFAVGIEELNLKSPPLGFVNTRSGCEYLVRRPMRRDWRQGVRSNSVVSTGTGNQAMMRDIAACIKGDYPSIKEARGMVRSGNAVAVSRDIALTKHLASVRVVYKWYGVVGVLTKNNTFKVKKAFKHVAPLLEGLLK